MARRDVLLRIMGDPDDGKNAIREVLREVEDFDGTEASARLILRKQGIEEQIDKVKARLANLNQQEASPKVNAKIARAVEQLDRLELKLEKLDHKDVEVNVDVDRSGSLRRAAGVFASIDRSVDHSFRRIPFLGGLLSAPIKVARVALSGLTTGIETLPRVFSAVASAAASAFGVATDTVRGVLAGTTSISSVLGSVVSGLVGLASSAAAAGLSIGVLVAVTGAFVIALNAVLGAVIAVGAALVALVASAAAAVGGFVAIGAALAAAFGPALLVGIALIQRFAAVVQARKAREQELERAVEDQKAAEQQRAAALDASRRAHEQLAQATVDGNREMQQSVFDLRDAELGLESSRLGVKEARLNLLDAKKALRDFRNEKGLGGASLDSLFKRATDVTTDPAQQRKAIGQIQRAGQGDADPLELQRRILAVQRAQLGIKEAINQTAHAERDLSTATRMRANYVRQGLNAYRPYRQALEGVRQADERLAQAQAKATTAHTKYEQKLRQLNTTERGFLGTLDRFLAGFKSLAQVVTAPIFAGLERALDAMRRVMADPAIQAGLQGIGRAIGSVFTSLSRSLSTPEWRAAMAGFARDAAYFIGQGGKAFSALLTIIRIIAQTAMPEARRATRDVVGFLQRIAAQPDKIRAVVAGVVDQFKVWARFAGAVARLVIDLFVSSAPSGKSLAASMTRIVTKWDEWIRHNPDKVRRFFHDAVEQVKDIVRQIARVVVWLRDNLPKAAAKAKSAFEAIGPVLTALIGLLEDFNRLQGNVSKFVMPLAPHGSSGGVKPGTPKAPPGYHWNLSTGKLEKDAPRGPKRIVNTASFDRAAAAINGNILSDALPTLDRLRMPEPQPVVAVAGGGGSVTNVFNIPRPLDATKPIDPDNTAALLQQAWEQRGGGLT